MNTSTIQVENIFLPTDFSEASEVAFWHALKIALVAKAELRILHVMDKDSDEELHFPKIRETLERWKVLPENSSKADLLALGLGVMKAAVKSGNVVKAALTFLQEHPSDLIVLATRHESGRARWFGGSVAEPIARKAGEMTLFLPNNSKGIVDGATGHLTLKTILIPVADKPIAQPSIESARRIIHSLQLPPGTVECLHIGSDKPALNLPTDSTWNWNYTQMPGSAVSTILHHAQAIQADLIIMTTDGPDGFLDGLRGTTSERVLAETSCPVLVIPNTVFYN